MKTILLPTDFSPASEKALEYTIELAKFIDAKIIVANTFYVPAANPEFPTIIPDSFYTEAQEDSEAEMKKICKRIGREKNMLGKNLTSEYIYEYNFPANAIVSLAKEKKPDLIVMGTMSKEHLLGFFDSTTLEVIQSIACPVLIVQKESMFVPFKNIYFALKDLNRDILTAGKIISLFRPWNPYITLFHITDGENSFQEELEEESALIFMNAVKDTSGYSKVRLKRIHEKIFSDAVTGYLEDHEPDLIVLLKQERSWIKEVFHKSMTRFLLKHLSSPLLIMPAK